MATADLVIAEIVTVGKNRPFSEVRGGWFI
jgi:hypothetical protein